MDERKVSLSRCLWPAAESRRPFEAMTIDGSSGDWKLDQRRQGRHDIRRFGRGGDSDAAETGSPEDDGDTTVVVPRAAMRRHRLAVVDQRRDVWLGNDIEVTGSLRVERGPDALDQGPIDRGSGGERRGLQLCLRENGGDLR